MDTVYRRYGGLFVQPDAEDNEAGEGDTPQIRPQTFKERRAWFLIMEGVADTLNMKTRKVTSLPLPEFFNWWAYNKEKSDYLEEQRRTQT